MTLNRGRPWSRPATESPPVRRHWPRQATLGLLQAPDDALAPDPADEFQVATDDQQVACSGQPDVEHLPGAGLVPEAVDGKHDCGPLQPLEAEHVPVEEVVVLPVG